MSDETIRLESSFIFDTDNSFFQLAANYVNHTRQSIFLTGKAGTGKTTFLKYIRETTYKQVVVAAPTGIAAINAGGVTVHSLFQLPFEPFIPTSEGRKHYHSAGFKMNKRKLDLLRGIELLIIDEVSMLRADLLDAIDSSLRRVRRNNFPFGGVQMLYIGDPFQLPPVVKDQEWNLLQQYYKSPFFFHSKVFEQNYPIFIELKKIYRQKDQHFIDLLNRTRNNEMTVDDIDVLNALYHPDFEPEKDEKYIILTTHNFKANIINQQRLEELEGEVYSFEGIITKDFPLQMLPTEQTLYLKKGAQVMFIKNDVGEYRRYYNGRLATVVALKEKTIRVRLADSDTEFDLVHDIWENIRYTHNPSTGFIEEELLGSFSQYPIRLAWAITIHKSQGLTFEKAIIDAGRAFAPGQVYVALSRCTSLEGIVLYSKIDSRTVFCDPEVFSYTDSELSLADLEQNLEQEKKIYWRERLINAFDISILLKIFAELKPFLPSGEELCFDDAKQCISEIEKNLDKEYEVARKFQVQLHQLINDVEKSGDISLLKERVEKAVEYFCAFIEKNILQPLNTHSATFKKEKLLKEYSKILAASEKQILFYLKRMQSASYGEIQLIEQKNKDISKEVFSQQKEEKKKQSKGASAIETLKMFRQGLAIQDIAKARNYSPITIEGHLATCIKNGDLSVFDIMNAERVEFISMMVEAESQKNEDSVKLTPIKEKLGDEYSYFEIRAVVNHLEYTKGFENNNALS